MDQLKNSNFNIIQEVERNIAKQDEKLFVYISQKNSDIIKHLIWNLRDGDTVKMNRWYIIFRNSDEKSEVEVPASFDEIANEKIIAHAFDQESLVYSAACVFVSLITTLKQNWNSFLTIASQALILYRKNGSSDKTFWIEFCNCVYKRLPTEIQCLNSLGDELLLNF